MPNKHGHHWIRDKKRKAIYARDGWLCLWCGCDTRIESNATLDHFLPRVLGGTNDASNLFCACHACNSKRAHMPALMFAFQYSIIDQLDVIVNQLDKPLVFSSA